MTGAARKAGRITTIIATALLWLATVILSTGAVYYTYTLAIFVYDMLGGRQVFTGVFLGQITALISGLIWLGVIIVTGEYHLRHAGEKKSWKLLAVVLGIQLLIIVVGIVTTGAIPFR